MPTRWVGIDEAGYGPNLGPLVMSSVTAESPDDRRPDVWGDLAGTVARAGGDPDRLWVDDSKALYRPGHGRDRLDRGALALVAAVSGAVPTTLGGLLQAVAAGTLDDAELTAWLVAGDPELPRFDGRPFEGAPWRLVGARSVVVGPSRFNRSLAASGSKARVHFEAFAALLQNAWESSPPGVETVVRGDKHGGRHFYYEPLVETFPDAWIDRGVEGPELSRYTIRQGPRRLALSLQPRADSGDGLVALASMVSKAIREQWMEVFNAHWAGRVAGLKPTAGYPVDAARFRRDLEAAGLPDLPDLDRWWRWK